jgi:hypothetical protein
MKKDEKIHNADMKKIDKQLAKEIKEHDTETIEQRFSYLIREKMTDKQFWKWASGWLDVEDICDQAEEWFEQCDIEEQKEEFKEAKKFIK